MSDGNAFEAEDIVVDELLLFVECAFVDLDDDADLKGSKAREPTTDDDDDIESDEKRIHRSLSDDTVTVNEPVCHEKKVALCRDRIISSSKKWKSTQIE
jgi:hypothetical protein